MKLGMLFLLILTLSHTIFCLDNGKIIILNGPPCAGKTTMATELQKRLEGSRIVRLDDIQKEAIIELGTKFGLFTCENQQGPDNKYGYNGLGHFIQYVCEQQTCTDQEMKELLELRLKPFEKIVALAQKGITVIFDSVVCQANDHLDECIGLMEGMDVTFVLLYLPFEATANRYAKSGRGKHGILHVFGYNYPWFYRIREKLSEPALEQFSYQKMISVLHNLDSDISLALRERCIKEVADRFQLPKDQQVTLTPRMFHDLVIDVQQLPVKDCIEQIIEHIRTRKNKSSVFFNNRFLSKPRNLEILKIVPKLYPE